MSAMMFSCFPCGGSRCHRNRCFFVDVVHAAVEQHLSFCLLSRRISVILFLVSWQAVFTSAVKVVSVAAQKLLDIVSVSVAYNDACTICHQTRLVPLDPLRSRVDVHRSSQEIVLESTSPADVSSTKFGGSKACKWTPSVLCKELATAVGTMLSYCFTCVIRLL
jgi:hypothetical protein